jgi:hypothetical protein
MSIAPVEGTLTVGTKTLLTIHAVDDGNLVNGSTTKPATTQIDAAVAIYNAYLTAPVYEDLSGVAVDTPATSAIPLVMPAQANGITVTLTNTSTIGFVTAPDGADTASAGRWAYTGTHWVDTRVKLTDYAYFAFSPATVRAWGCVITDLGDFSNSRVTMRFVAPDDTYIEWTPALPFGLGYPYNGQGFFVGVRASFNIKQVQFRMIDGSVIDQYGYTYYTAEIAANVTALPPAPSSGGSGILITI